MSARPSPRALRMHAAALNGFEPMIVFKTTALKTPLPMIVGGDGAFFDRMVNAISVTKSVDGFVRNGETAKTLLKDYLSGKTSLPQDLKDVLSRPALGAGEVQQLTLSAFLGHLMSGGDDAERSRIGQLLEYAKKLGVAELPLAK